MSNIIMTDKKQQEPTFADMMLILREIRAQNERLLTRHRQRRHRSAARQIRDVEHGARSGDKGQTAQALRL